MADPSGRRVPAWLTALTVLALAAIGASLAYAVAIAAANFSRIGV
jgi:hypothetical protein